MKTNTKKISLETLYNLLFTIGVSLILMGVGFIEIGVVEFRQGAETILLGIALIALGVFIYWLKTKGDDG